MWIKGWISCNNLFSRNPQTEKGLIICFKGKAAAQSLLHTFQHLSPPSFPLFQYLRMPFVSFLFMILGLLMSSWKTTQQYPNPTLDWVAMSKDRSEHSVAESSRKIFLSSLVRIYRPHQTNNAFLHPGCQMTTLIQGRTPPQAVFYFPFLKADLQEATC